jgi:hypothetical protein
VIKGPLENSNSYAAMCRPGGASTLEGIEINL